MGKLRQPIGRRPPKAAKMTTTAGLHGTDRDRQIQRTWHGMAHWAQGPQTCGSCHYWAEHPEFKACFVCHMHPLISHGEWGAQVPKEAPCCKHFVQKDPSDVRETAKRLKAIMDDRKRSARKGASSQG
jgi:hypothetical protein